MRPIARPPRRWAIVGPPAAGKSTFACAMRQPLAVLDYDGRFADLAGTLGVEALEPDGDLFDPVGLTREIDAAKGLGTVVVDSLTAFISPKVAQIIQEIDEGRHKNKAAAWKSKAVTMRLLLGAVARHRGDVLWIWHTGEASDARGQAIQRETVPRTERARLLGALNAVLEIVEDNGRLGVRVQWARNEGRVGEIFWDDSGVWAGVPEQLDALQLGTEGPYRRQFASPEEAVAYAVEKRAFGLWSEPGDAGHAKALQHGQHAYEAVKRVLRPRSAAEMRVLWEAEIMIRQRAVDAGTDMDAVRAWCSEVLGVEVEVGCQLTAGHQRRVREWLDSVADEGFGHVAPGK